MPDFGYGGYYMANATKLDPNAPNRIGDKVVYGVDSNNNGKLDPGEIRHSADVIKVDSLGNTQQVLSKEGSSDFVIHHPTSQQPSYGNFMEWYRSK